MNPVTLLILICLFIQKLMDKGANGKIYIGAWHNSSQVPIGAKVYQGSSFQSPKVTLLKLVQQKL
jgi:hypothetical protein